LPQPCQPAGGFYLKPGPGALPFGKEQKIRPAAGLLAAGPSEVKEMTSQEKEMTMQCALCGYTASGRFEGDICPRCNLTYWRCRRRSVPVAIRRPTSSISPATPRNAAALDVLIPACEPDDSATGNGGPRLAGAPCAGIMVCHESMEMIGGDTRKSRWLPPLYLTFHPELVIRRV